MSRSRQLFVVLFAAACHADHDVLVVVETTAVDGVRAYQLAVLDQSTCPTQVQFVDGASASAGWIYYTEGLWADRDEAPEIGKLPDRTISFGALVRDESCGVTGYGCTRASPDTKTVVIHVDAVSPPESCGATCPSVLCPDAIADAGSDAPI